MMPAWLALAGIALSGIITVRSYLAVKEAERTGQLRFVFWRVRGWGQRDVDPNFFERGLKFAQARTIFFAALTLVLLAYLLEASLALY